MYKLSDFVKFTLQELDDFTVKDKKINFSVKTAAGIDEHKKPVIIVVNNDEAAIINFSIYKTSNN